MVVVCVESCLVAYLYTKRGTPPEYTKYIIQTSLIHLHIKNMCLKVYDLCMHKQSHIARSRSGNTTDNSNSNPMNSIELHTHINSNDIENNNNLVIKPDVNDTNTIVEVDKSFEEPDTVMTALLYPIPPSADDEIGQGGSKEWGRVARSIDRICRIILPLVFTIQMYEKFKEVNQI